jgi:hypothetical protein
VKAAQRIMKATMEEVKMVEEMEMVGVVEEKAQWR